MIIKCDFAFFGRGVKYEYTCLPMWLASGPQLFTKLLKPKFSYLRKRGFCNVVYLDDSLLQELAFRCETVKNSSEPLSHANLDIYLSSDSCGSGLGV